MVHKVAPDVSDAEIEAAVSTCEKHVDILREIQQSDPESYRIAIKNLQKIFRGEWGDREPPLDPDMVELILMQLGEETMIMDEEGLALESREEVDGLLARR